MSAELVQFPPQDVTRVAIALRNLADAIEQGQYGDAHNLAWAIDCGDKRIEVGLLGTCPELATTLHYLFALAMRKVESAASG